VYEEIYPELKGKKASKHIIFYRIMEDRSIEITKLERKRPIAYCGTVKKNV